MARAKKTLSHKAKMALARAEHARATKAVARAAARLADCKACDINKLEGELERLSKDHGVEIKYSDSEGKKTSKKRGKKKASKKAASKKVAKKSSKRKAAKKKSSSKRRSKK